MPQQYERARPLIGSHIPVSGRRGGLAYAAAVGAEVIQVFAANPRGWAAGPGDPAQDAALRAAGIPVFVHAPYLINLGSPAELTASRSVSALEHSLRPVGEIGGAIPCWPAFRSWSRPPATATPTPATSPPSKPSATPAGPPGRARLPRPP